MTQRDSIGARVDYDDDGRPRSRPPDEERKVDGATTERIPGLVNSATRMAERTS